MVCEEATVRVVLSAVPVSVLLESDESVPEFVVLLSVEVLESVLVVVVVELPQATSESVITTTRRRVIAFLRFFFIFRVLSFKFLLCLRNLAVMQQTVHI
jgi:hypothetical protein